MKLLHLNDEVLDKISGGPGLVEHGPVNFFYDGQGDNAPDIITFDNSRRRIVPGGTRREP